MAHDKLDHQHLEQNVRQFLSDRNDDGTVRIKESTTIEFKASFSSWSKPSYAKTMSSFANNCGGYMIFGVTDFPRQIIGLKHNSDFEYIKPENFTKQLNLFFLPAIEYDMGTITLKEGGGCKDSSPEKKIGWIYTFESEMKPVMASKGCRSENVTAGDMFYRYSDRTEKMKLPEMSRIISERVTKELNRIRLLGSVIQDFIGKFFSEYSNNSYGPAVFFKPSVAEKTESLPLSTAIDERIPHSPGLMEPTVKCPDKFQPIRDPRFYFGNS